MPPDFANLPPGVELPPVQVLPVEPEYEVPIRLLSPEERVQRMAATEAAEAKARELRAEQLRKRMQRWVYFIQAGAAGPVKIGISRDVDRRRGELQREHKEPLRVLARVEGTYQDEQALHQRFATHRLHGEWFNPDPEILAHVSVLNGMKS